MSYYNQMKAFRIPTAINLLTVASCGVVRSHARGHLVQTGTDRRLVGPRGLHQRGRGRLRFGRSTVVRTIDTAVCTCLVCLL